MPFDTYRRRAQLYPALLVILPVPLMVATVWPSAMWGAAWGIVVGCGGTFLLSQFGRDSGRKKQAQLFESWDGAPTTRLLRHRGNTDAPMLDQRHAVLRRLGLKIPTEDDEAAGPAAADAAYKVAVHSVREFTRNRDEFALVFEENCNFGFRRNLLGNRSWGIAIAGIGVLVGMALAVVSWRIGTPVNQAALIVTAADAVLIGFWTLAVTPQWVKTAADAYAEALFGAVVRVEVPGSSYGLRQGEGKPAHD